MCQVRLGYKRVCQRGEGEGEIVDPHDAYDETRENRQATVREDDMAVVTAHIHALKGERAAQGF